jgi:YVTN family beta-propeller protein
MSRFIRFFSLLALIFQGSLSALFEYAYIPSPHYVNVIDANINTLVASILLPNSSTSAPYGMVISPDGTKLYVPDTTGRIYVIDTLTRAITATISGVTTGGNSAAITPDGTKIYLTCHNGTTDAVNVINTVNNTIIKVITMVDASQLVMSPDGSKVYVTTPANTVPNTVQVITTATDTVGAPITGANSGSFGGNGAPIIISKDGSKLYVTDGTNLTAITTSNNTALAPVSYGGAGAGRGMAITPDGTLVYIGWATNSGGVGRVYVFNTVNNTSSIISVPGVSGGTYFTNVSPDGQQVIAGAFGANLIPIIKTALNTTPAATVNIFTDTLNKSVFTTDSKKAFLPSNSAAVVVAYDVTNNAFISSITVPETPFPSFSPLIGPIRGNSAVSAQTKKNNFGLEYEFVNQVNWTAPANFSIATAFYQIYRDAANTQLAATVNGNTFVFYDHDRAKGQSYSYYIVAILSDGRPFPIGNTTITTN